MASVTQAQALIAFIVPKDITLRTSHTSPPESVQRLYEEMISPITIWFSTFHSSKDSTGTVSGQHFRDACGRINEINDQIRTFDYNWAVYGATLRSLVPAMDRAVALSSSTHPSRDRDYRCLRAAALNYLLQTRMPEALLCILGLEQEKLDPLPEFGPPPDPQELADEEIYRWGMRRETGVEKRRQAILAAGRRVADYFPPSTPAHYRERIIDPQAQSRETPPPTPKPNNPFPPEVWDRVLEDLPSLTGRHTAQSFGFELSERHSRHSDIWSKIIKDKEKWTSIATKQGLKIVLIGDDLHKLFADSTQQAYLALSTRDYSGDIRYDKTELLASLMPHRWGAEGQEVVFDESNITLNIDEPLHCPEFTIASLPRLFTSNQGQLRSAALYWKDSQYKLRTIGPNDIVGIGEPVSTLQDVSRICAVTLTHPEEMGLSGRRQQYFFESGDRPPVRPIFCDDGRNISRWELL